MICSLTGTLKKLTPPEVCVDVHGVGYSVSVPSHLFDLLEDGKEMTLMIETYVREDRLDLYGFTGSGDRILFRKLINVGGIGPKMALEICALPRSELKRAVVHDDAKILSAIKGIGIKRAEKILPDVKSICETYPDILSSADDMQMTPDGDDDALAALTALGYERATVLKALKALTPDVTRTEDRVAAVLRSL